MKELAFACSFSFGRRSEVGQDQKLEWERQSQPSVLFLPSLLVQQACLDLHPTSASWVMGRMLPPEEQLLGLVRGSWYIAWLPEPSWSRAPESDHRPESRAQ